MGKRSRSHAEDPSDQSTRTDHVKKSPLVDHKAVDPTLASLFASSAGPVIAPPKARYEQPPPPRRQKAVEESEEESEEEEEESDGDGQELSSIDGDLEDADISEASDEPEEEPGLDRLIEARTNPDRKRKRKPVEEDLEGKYMQKLAAEEDKEEVERQADRRLKRQRLMAQQDPDMSSVEQNLDEDVEKDDADDESANSGNEVEPKISTAPSDVPLHESIAPHKEAAELEKASRTVFLANVSTSAITSKADKKTLLTHMASFFSDIPAPTEGKPEHKVESIRFRSTAFAGTSLPKKAAFAKKELMETTTKSTNAYVVYSSAFAAREAVKKLNGIMVLDRHLRVDGVAHPSKTDHRRCVFVGNLGFVDDESMLDAAGENERKRSKIPSDVEEGLWRQFGKAGTVESVRVVRDERTRVGKGFAYVQFEDANSVEAALLFNEKKYPPMLSRVLRVVRAKAVGKTANAQAAFNSRDRIKNSKHPNRQQIYNPKISSQDSSLQGRAGKLLGRAGAAQFKKREGSGANDTAIGKRGEGRKSGGSAIVGITKTPEAIVFEGYRASANSGKPKDLKFGGGGGGKGKGKPKTRSSKRASEWKKGAGKSK